MRPRRFGTCARLTDFHDGVTNAFLGSYSPDGRLARVPARGNGLFGLYRMHPDGSHQQAILPLSPFRPSLIDWGVRAGDD